MDIRRASERGAESHGWLRSFHTFSFADYYDPAHMGFRSLRVINEDFVEPGMGFPTHPHRDMEILTYVLDGALAHRDSMGNGSAMRPGDLQRMSAGTGVTHSEYNASKSEPVHFLQIWILPDRRGYAPSYEQKSFSAAERSGKLRLLASRDGKDGALELHQDVKLFATLLTAGEQVEHSVGAGRHAFLHVARGAAEVSGELLTTGDAAKSSESGSLIIAAKEPLEALLFDLG